jgi:hypothetical protein
LNPSRELRWRIFEGALNTTILIDFLRRLIKGQTRKVFLILDNLRMHHAKQVKAWPTPSANEALTPVSSRAPRLPVARPRLAVVQPGRGPAGDAGGRLPDARAGHPRGLWAIVAGSILGAGLLGWVAKLGCDSGLASAGLMHAVYGRALPACPSC